jgi:hypothetical protein
LLQTAFSSASTTPPCPLSAAMCSAVTPSCKDGGVSRQSGARMLHCCPYRQSNTQIEEGGKNQGITQGIRFTQPKIIARIYVHILFVCRESISWMQCKQTQSYARTSTHKLKIRHKHTHTHTYAQGKPEHAENMSSRHQTYIQIHHSESLACSPTSPLKASCTSRLRTHTLVA